MLEHFVRKFLVTDSRLLNLRDFAVLYFQCLLAAFGPFQYVSAVWLVL